MNILAPHVNFFGYAVFVLRYEIIFADAASNDGVETSLDHEHCFNTKTSHFVCCITQEYCRNKHNTCITGVKIMNHLLRVNGVIHLYLHKKQ